MDKRNYEERSPQRLKLIYKKYDANAKKSLLKISSNSKGFALLHMTLYSEHFILKKML